ncbi:MAG: hypothetical protein NXI15_10255 [Gammaproteobacteria bacterium]|nr:hypothetical protein [Gammaproteobacteria bacterium]
MIHKRRQQSLKHSLLCLGLLLASTAALAADNAALLPSWQTLEFEEKAFWAVANSRLELLVDSEDDSNGIFVINSSVPGNSEQITINLDIETGQLLTRERLSQGKKDRRFKSYDYRPDMVVRERREPMAQSSPQPDSWEVTSETRIRYPEMAAQSVITDPYLLVLLAGRLQAQSSGASMEVMVNTDQNFYRVSLTRGNGIPVETNYQRADGTIVAQLVDTVGVVLRAEPAGTLLDQEDFSFMGLQGDIILLYDEQSDLPLQIRGEAPRVGSTEINLKSVGLRSQNSGG